MALIADEYWAIWRPESPAGLLSFYTEDAARAAVRDAVSRGIVIAGWCLVHRPPGDDAELETVQEW